MSVYTPQHKCRESTDPRQAGYCACGEPMSEGLKRNREFERELVRQASVGLSIDPEPLLAFAQGRADHFASEYGHDFPDLGRDLVQETMDEIADGINYCAWKLDAIHRGLVEGGDRVVHLQRGLRHGLLWFEEMRQAR